MRRRRRVARRAVPRAVLSLLAALVLGLAALGCGTDEPASDTGRTAREVASPAPPPIAKLSVAVDSYPLAYFARRIGGDLVDVSFPAPAGVDPAFWTPDPDTVARYQQADLILVNGSGYAKWIDTATLPGSRVIDTSAAFVDRLLVLDGAVTHSHGGAGEHSHAGYSICWWLDPELAAEQAAAIASAFERERPESKAAFEDGLGALGRDLETLDARLEKLAGRIGSTPLLFSHPVYAYLIRRYQLDARSLHWEPTEAPGDQGLAQLDQALVGHPARLVIWEAAPVAEASAALEARGIESVVFAPLAEAPAEGDYLSAMNDNAARLEAAFPAT